MEKEDYEQEAINRGAILCVDKMETDMVQNKLLEYAQKGMS